MPAKYRENPKVMETVDKEISSSFDKAANSIGHEKEGGEDVISLQEFEGSPEVQQMIFLFAEKS